MKDIKDCEECKTIKLGEPRCRYCLTDLIFEGFANLKEAKRDGERLDFIIKNRHMTFRQDENGYFCFGRGIETFKTPREAIDVAMKEGEK